MNPLLLHNGELYKCDVGVHYTEGQTHLHSTAAGGPVRPGKSEDVCLHVVPAQKVMKTCTFVYLLYIVPYILWSHFCIVHCFISTAVCVPAEGPYLQDISWSEGTGDRSSVHCSSTASCSLQGACLLGHPTDCPIHMVLGDSGQDVPAGEA